MAPGAELESEDKNYRKEDFNSIEGQTQKIDRLENGWIPSIDSKLPVCQRYASSLDPSFRIITVERSPALDGEAGRGDDQGSFQL